MVSRWPSMCLPVRISFPDDNLSKHQWIFIKLGMCIDIVEICFGFANWKFFTELSARHKIMAGYFRFTFL